MRFHLNVFGSRSLIRRGAGRGAAVRVGQSGNGHVVGMFRRKRRGAGAHCYVLIHRGSAPARPRVVLLRLLVLLLRGKWMMSPTGQSLPPGWQIGYHRIDASVTAGNTGGRSVKRSPTGHVVGDDERRNPGAAGING